MKRIGTMLVLLVIVFAGCELKKETNYNLTNSDGNNVGNSIDSNDGEFEANDASKAVFSDTDKAAMSAYVDAHASK